MTLSTVPAYDADALDRVGDRAVVVGGSIAGLAAARVLADAFSEVVLLDRDELPDEAVARRGVPQAEQPHMLLEAGRATFEDLLAGFGADLHAAGAVCMDDLSQFTFYDEGGAVAGRQDPPPTYIASRPLLEQIVRRHVTEDGSVTARGGCTVTDYLVDDSDTSVTGVAYRASGGDVVDLSADLVVDATGRTSRTPTWLAAHGYEAPVVDEVEIDVAYASTFVDRPPDNERTVILLPSAPRTRGGAAFPIEGDRWLVQLAGVHGDHPPGDRDAFVEFAGTLPIPDLQVILQTHEWTDGEIMRYPFPSNRRHRYEDLDRFPDGLVVVGDAIASFNPIYAQGMSVAALEALQLHHALAAGGLSDLPKRYFERAAAVVDIAWQLAVGSDSEFAQTTGPVPRGAGLFGRYVGRLTRKAHDDERLATALYRVITMEAPPTSLLRPGILTRTLAPSLSSLPGFESDRSDAPVDGTTSSHH